LVHVKRGQRLRQFRTYLAPVLAIPLVAAGVAGSGTAHTTPAGMRSAAVSQSPDAAVPSALRLPTAPPAPTTVITASPTPASTSTPFEVIRTRSCAPGQVPDAVPVPNRTPKVSSRYKIHVPILAYHRIATASESRGSIGTLVVSPATFAAQMAQAKSAGWRSITLATLAEDMEAGIKPAPKTFVITFDDGWADGYTNAYPILRNDGFVATYFVIAGRINHPQFLSVDQLRALVAAGNEIGDHTLDHSRVAGGTSGQRALEIDSAAATIAAATGFWPETLAYPTGGVSLKGEASVKACTGMKLAVTENVGARETWSTRFEIPRLAVHSRTSPETLLRWLANPPSGGR